MKRKTTKITGIILTLVMLVTMLGAFSLTASAAETVVAWNDTDNDGIQDSGEATYTNLSTALSAGGTVKLTADYTLGNNATAEQYISMSSGTATLDLNGYTLTCASIIEKEIIVLSGSADLTITDGKTTGVFQCMSRTKVTLSDSSKLTFAGGIIQTDTVYTKYHLTINKSENAVFEITGGKHYSNPTEYVAANHKVTIGEISNTEPRYTVSEIETNEVVAWNDADNDGVIDSGEQVFSDMDSALTAGVDLKMNSDIFRDSICVPPGSLKITSTMTIDLNGYSIVASAYCFEVKGGTLTIKDSAGGGQIWCQNDESYSAITVSSGIDIGLIVEDGTILGSISHYGAHNYPDAVVLNGGNYSFDPSKYIKDRTLTAGQDSSGLWGIRPKAENACSVTIGGEYFYTGEAITPTIVVTDLSNSEILAENVDYTVALTENVDVGTATATVTFINDYRGSIATTFAIGCDHSYSEHTTATDLGNGTHNFTCTVCVGNGTEDHTLTYSADDDTDTITAVCSANCGYGGTITIKAEGKTYDGTPVTATLDGSIDGVANPEITYTGNTTAGTHTASITLGGATVSVDFTIAPATIIDAVITVNSTVYNGDVQTPNGSHVTVTVGGVVLEHNKDYYISVLPDDYFINAGTYTITIYGEGNYTGSVEKTFTIEKARPTSSDFASGLPIDPVYTGETVEIDVTAGDGIVGMGAITVKYYDANGSEVESAINAGTYTVKIDVAEGDNYEAVTDLEIGCFTIGKATPVVTAPTAIEDLIYKGEAQALVNAGSTTGGTLMYALYEGEYQNGAAPDSSEFSAEIPTPTDAGTYTVFYYVEGNDNYYSFGGQWITVTIGKATPTLVVTSPTPSVLPGNTILLSYTLTGVKGEALTNKVAIINAKVGEDDCENDGLKVTVLSTAVIGEDKLVVTLRAHGDGNYDDSEVFTLTLDIGMADFSGEIAALETEIAELTEMIENKADADEITQSLTEIANRVKALEETGATDAELEAVKTELTTAYTDAIKDAVADLETKIAAQIDPTELAAEIKKVTDLIDALDDTYATDAKLAEAITKAENELAAAVSVLEDKIAEEVEKLQGQITSNDTDIEGINTSITTINGLIDALEAADEALDGKITDAVNAAKSDLTTAVSTLEDKIAEEVEKLQGQITSNDTDIEGINTSISTINGLIDVLEAADEALDGKMTDAVNTAKNDLAAAVSTLEDKIAESVEKLQGQINSNDTDIEGINTNIATINSLIDALKKADKALDGKISNAVTKAENELKEAQDELKELIGDVQADLYNAKAELDKAIEDLDAAIKQGNADLSAEIASLNTALTNAKAALEKTDADNKAELTARIEAADATLEAAIKAVQKDLDNAKAELNKAIADGDTALDGKIAALNEALASAKAALEATSAANKSELTTKINEAYASLDEAVKAVQKKLDDLKAALEAKDNELESKDAELERKDSELKTFIIIVCVISGVTLCGSGAFVIWFFIDRKKGSNK